MTIDTGVPPGRALTVDDLDALPEDGLRHELVDGVHVVSAAPTPLHQRVNFQLCRILDDAAPEHLWVVPPIDVVLAHDTVLEPDVVVAPRDRLTGKRLDGPPLLAVEVLSPSTALTDLNTKHDRLERADAPHYWVVDPVAPRLIAWELQDGRYVEVADVSGDTCWHAERPFPVSIRPTDLVR
ncbi:Uma2 family endonuclease [Nocardioides humi]|nr:Uma2 family endonuclease [Nocardioides humi]